MAYIPPDIVARAKEMDLLTYLKNYEPEELVRCGGGAYCTRTHDSLKISNGKWCWFSRSIGGRTALDYLIKVRGLPFLEAVEQITGRAAALPPQPAPAPRQAETKTLLLPRRNPTTDKACAYLAGRGIDRELLDYCMQTGRLYESAGYHNAVFVGQDPSGRPRYACGEPERTLRARPPAATSGSLSGSPPGTAAPCTCLRAPLTCSPMGRCKRYTGWTGGRTTCSPLPACTARKGSCGKAASRWRSGSTSRITRRSRRSSCVWTGTARDARRRRRSGFCYPRSTRSKPAYRQAARTITIIFASVRACPSPGIRNRSMRDRKENAE